MYFGLLISDILALTLALGLGILLRKQIFGSPGIWEVFINTLPGFILIAILIYALQGQYLPGGIDPVNEIRQLTQATCLAFLLLVVYTFLTQTSSDYSRLIFVLSWFLALIFVPIFRFFLRVTASKLNIWGVPVTVLGNGPTTRKIVNYLANKSQLGWQPKVVIGTQPGPLKLNSGRTPYIQVQNDAQCKMYLDLFRMNTIFIVQDEVPPDWLESLNNASHPYIRKIVVIPSFGEVQNTIIKAHDIAGSLGLELEQNLFTPWGQIVKRLTDILFASLMGIFLLPMIGVLAILIKLDSRGRAFYRQTRIGYNGKPFEFWKFRTMITNADEILQEYLENNQDFRKEWEENQKLKNDPRVTRMGQFLRKLSLDELPQLWNILRGDMSLIGPRPCMPEQVPLYDKVWDLYKNVRPGMTGLWQVSGRNNTTYEERVYYDGYYVRNWSIWLDIYILIKTFWVVLSREGAF